MVESLLKMTLAVDSLRRQRTKKNIGKLWDLIIIGDCRLKIREKAGIC